MDRRAKQPERVLDLTGYVPEFLREVREFRQLYEAQESELKRLYGKMDELWKDSLIPSATIQGIKRFEYMIGLKPYPGDTLEERRASVSLKWNQQLPYTLPRLQERLDVVVGPEGYGLWVRGSAYELELWVIDQPYRVLQDLRDMTRQMIPANLVFIFAGLYPTVIPVETTSAVRLELVSDFYARYNREFLYLDGTWLLDGIYLLNGYKEIESLDLYPARLGVLGSYEVRSGTEGYPGFRSGVRAGPRMVSSWHGIGQVWQRVLAESAMSVRTGAREQSAAACRMSAGPASAEVRAETGGCMHVMAEAGEQAVTAGGLLVRTFVPAGPELNFGLAVEKDLWYLDGTYLLDGTKLLDAEITNYEL